MMINAKQLLQQLTQKLHPIYLLCGDEPYLKLKAEMAICKIAKSQGFTEHHKFRVDAQFNMTQFYDALYHVSLFADKGIVELHLSEKIPEEVRQFLFSYAQNPIAEKILLVTSTKLDSNTQKSKWYQAIADVGIIVQIWPISYAELPVWVSEQLKQAGFKASKEAIQLLAEKGENNLATIEQAIEKLKLLNIETEISPTDILNCMADNAAYDIFQLVDNILQGNTPRAHRILMGLKNQGTEPVLILWVLLKDIRVLAEIADAKEAIENIFSKHQVWRNRQTLLKQAFKKHVSSFWSQCVVKANQIDMMIKGVKSGNVWDELFNLCLKIQKIPLST